MVFGLFKRQFIEVIEWPNQDDETIAWKFPVAGNEIKCGAQLTVREGQTAVFLNEGQIADIFKPGRHELLTQNMPMLTSLGAWRHGFESPFKADVVFVSSREFRLFKWGTPQPITLRDPDFGVVRVGAFGGFGIRIIDAKDFIKECAGVRDLYSKSDIEEVLRREVISKFTTALAEMQVGAIDMATKYEVLAAAVLERIARSFDSYGIELTNFTIESVNVPKEVQAAIDEQSKMNLALNNEQKYAKWQMLKGMPDAMASRGAAGGIATDIAVGQVMGQMMQSAMQPLMNTQAQAAGTSVQSENSATVGMKFCSECGVKLPRAAKFCSECGFKFE